MTAETAPTVRVLESTNPPDGTTRYIDQVVTFADPRFRFIYMSPKNLLKRADVFHVHWPEVLVRGRNTAETALRCIALRLALLLMRARGTAILRTLHNLEPHEGGSILERRTLAKLDARTDYFVAINPITEIPGGRGVYIPHGHYRDRFRPFPRSETVAGRLVYAGLIRPYKGVEALITCFLQSETPGTTLRLVGRPTPDLQQVIEDAESQDDRISSRFGFLPDEDFVWELSQAELICLPYSEMHNSGMLLVALSLDKPVLVPDTPTTRSLEAEVGAGWIYRFEGELTPAIVDDALRNSRQTARTSAPLMEEREWRRVAERYMMAFDKAKEHAQRGK